MLNDFSKIMQNIEIKEDCRNVQEDLDKLQCSDTERH